MQLHMINLEYTTDNVYHGSKHYDSDQTVIRDQSDLGQYCCNTGCQSTSADDKADICYHEIEH